MKRNPTKTIFFIYCGILAWTVIFKMAVSIEEIRNLVGTRSLNLIPFDYRGGIPRILIRETAMNVLIFIPLGCYLKMLELPGGKAILYGCVFSFVAELLQLLLAIGVCDVTDLLANTLGTAMGVWFCILIRKLCADKQKADRYINTAAALTLLLFFAMVLLLEIAN